MRPPPKPKRVVVSPAKPKGGVVSPAKPTKITWDGQYNYVSVGNILSIDLADANKGKFTPGITFGSQYSEGISSNRTGTVNPSGMDFYTAGAARLSIDSRGHVGIGTSSPGAALHIFQVKGDSGLGQALLLTSQTGGLGSGIRLNTAKGKTYEIFSEGGKLCIADINAGANRLIVDQKGNVGIGASLNIGGDTQVNGNVNVKGDVILQGADCAEEFTVTDTGPVDPGTVMVIAAEGSLMASQQAYDKRVAGVISGAGDLRPGIILDNQSKETGRLPLAMTGKVYCKVDAAYGPVEVGDLLTTSPTCGHAMKASDCGKAFGTVIGKALRGLESGKGLIPILVALQ